MDTLISDTENLTVVDNPPPLPPMGLTENLSPTFLSTGNPCLDFFFHVVPDTPPSDLTQRLCLAWTHDPLLTLKLVFNLRGVRGTGKTDKEGFYTAALWLHDHHPKTLALNVGALANFGYLKDLPEILYRLHEGNDVRRINKEEWIVRKRGIEGSRRWKAKKLRREREKKVDVSEENEKEVKMEKKEKVAVLKNAGKVGNVEEKEKARRLRKEKNVNRTNRALERYNNDPRYRFLYDCVCDVFAEILNADLQHLKSGNCNRLSLAAKWCPSIDSSYDKVTLLCQGIARGVFPLDSDADFKGLEESNYVYKVRDMLRKEVLVPIRRALELPEVFMSAKQWESLPYNRVPSVAMKNYKGLFQKHDKERFDEYLENVKSGKAKIAAGALLPHEIIGALKDEDGGKVAELQWNRMVEDLSKKGKLTNCIAVCDVSGSMSGTPMEVSVALGLLVSELSEEPWKGKVITFTANPELHIIEGETLESKTQFIRNMEWGGDTDFQKVFDRILEVAVEGKLTEDQMIKRVFAFSDMEFDDASGIHFRKFVSKTQEEIEDEDEDVEKEEKEFDPRVEWETDYEVIQRKYREKGYSRVPEIVFWNLRNSSSTPVVAKQPGVALVSGFSKNLLTLFLEEGGIVNPEDVMGFAIAGEEYKKLVVYD